MPSWLSLIDVAFVAVALLFALGGLQRGFASQIAHIITFTGMGLFLLFAYPMLFTQMGKWFRSLNDTYLMWMLLFGVVVLAVGLFILISKLFAGLVKMKISARTDHVLGFHLGFIRGVLFTLLVMIFTVILGSQKFYDVFSEKSRVGRIVCHDLVPQIQPRLNKKEVGDKFDRMRDALINKQEAGIPD